jgi:transposase
VAAPEEMPREELIRLLAERDARITAQDRQITTLSMRVADLLEANEALAGKLARLEYLLSRNSSNSSMPPSKDDDPGKTPPAEKPKPCAGGGPKRKRGKQPGESGANLAWVTRPDGQIDRFPHGRYECGHDLAGARNLGVVDRY